MVSALKYFNAEASDEPATSDYTISNVDAEGNIVPMYTNIALDHPYTIADVVGYYDIRRHRFCQQPRSAYLPGVRGR